MCAQWGNACECSCRQQWEEDAGKLGEKFETRLDKRIREIQDDYLRRAETLHDTLFAYYAQQPRTPKGSPERKSGGRKVGMPRL